MLETMLRAAPKWLSQPGPEADIVVSSRGILRRNLTHYAFPQRCTDEERGDIEERVRDALAQTGFTEDGCYYSMAELERREAGFLAERYACAYGLLHAKGPRGIFVSRDQGLCIAINGSDHIMLEARLPGLQLEQVWSLLDEADDALSHYLGYAFDEDLGYLTADLSAVGTGLTLAAVLHLPGLVMANGIAELTEAVQEDDQELSRVKVKSGDNEAGDFFKMLNRATLGRSEEEFAFHLRQSIVQAADQERTARETLLHEGPALLEDRVGRALGIVRGARLLGEDEATSLLSSLRLGISSGLVEGYGVEQVNEMLLLSQPAHIELGQGRSCDEMTLNVERAGLFRARFS